MSEKPKRRTKSKYYLANFYEKHPGRRQVYRLREAVRTLEKAGYSVTAPDPDPAAIAPDPAEGGRHDGN